LFEPRPSQCLELWPPLTRRQPTPFSFIVDLFSYPFADEKELRFSEAVPEKALATLHRGVLE
jgi:hypothetical protein